MDTTIGAGTQHPATRGTSSLGSLGQGTAGSSPSDRKDDHGGYLLLSMRDKATRSFSTRLGNPNPRGPLVREAAEQTTLQRSDTRPSMLKLFSSKDSGSSRISRRLSRSSTQQSIVSTSIDWTLQKIEAYGSLESDSTLRPKAPYLVVTPDYIVKLKNRTDAMATFPQLAGGLGISSTGPTTEPPLVIPVDRIVSAFKAESTRPSFGIEVWWLSNTTHGSSRAEFCFNLPKERDDILHVIHKVKTSHRAEIDVSIPEDIEGYTLRDVFALEEPFFFHQRLESFPVVLRGIPRTTASRGFEELPRRTQGGPSYYLSIGANLLFIVEIASNRTNSLGTPAFKYYKFGIAALEIFDGQWSGHEERFVMKFRTPFEPPVTVELASKHYRQIILTLLKADRFLKPAWPRNWHNPATFTISGFQESHEPAPATEPVLEYGGLKRTLDSFLIAYNCENVHWEINFDSQFAPEFRLLPRPNREDYSPVQLLAVFRALRYNAFFRSLSFRDIDLSVLWNLPHDSSRITNVAYVSRNGLTLNLGTFHAVQGGNYLHQEFHALAFCAETIEQIDFTNSFRRPPGQGKGEDSAGLTVEFLTPILDLIRVGSTRCNRFILNGIALCPRDIEQLAKILKWQGTRIPALALSGCKLSAESMNVLAGGMFRHGHALQDLDISGNTNSMAAYTLSGLVEVMADLKRLNVSGTLTGTMAMDLPLISSQTLRRLENLEELDISHFKVNDATVASLAEYLSVSSKEKPQSPLRRLILNHCGLNGIQAARLFNAIGETGGSGMHLSISGNPLENGIMKLTSAIRASCGPAVLHVDMVEFRQETNYEALISSFAASSKITMLSLVGTGPTSVCSPKTITFFRGFFAVNTSVRCLDLSGYSGRLEEGQLGKHFGRALEWLYDNKTLTHLRIRNQNLNEHREKLGALLRRNRTLRMLDCQENNFSLTTLQYLVSCLRENPTLLEFSMPCTEQDRVWTRQLRDLNLPLHGGAAHGLEREQDSLRRLFEHQINEIHHQIAGNREDLETVSGRAISLDNIPPMGPEWPALDLADAAAHRTTSCRVASADVPITRDIPDPYHVEVLGSAMEDEPGGTSDPVSPASDAPTSPDWVGPSTPDDYDMPKLTGKFEEASFE